VTSYTVATAGPSSFKRDIKGKNPFLSEKGFFTRIKYRNLGENDRKLDKRRHFVLSGEISEVNDWSPEKFRCP